MKNRLVFVVSLFGALICSTCFGQGLVKNLVPNGGFEKLINCPAALSEIKLARPWQSSDAVTPDLFSACSENELVKVPCNIATCLEPFSGQNYAGCIVFTGNSDNGYGTGYYYSEDLFVKLSKVLCPGSQYEFSIAFHVEDSLFCKSVGYFHLLLSENEPSSRGGAYFYSKDAKIYKIPISSVSQKNEWTKVTINFVAQEEVKYLQLGLVRLFFLLSEYNKMIKNIPINIRRDYDTFILIDAVSLIDLCDKGIKNIFED